jgi:hypothetical protein
MITLSDHRLLLPGGDGRSARDRAPETPHVARLRASSAFHHRTRRVAACRSHTVTTSHSVPAKFEEPRIGDKQGQGETLRDLGKSLEAIGQRDEARELWRQSWVIFKEFDDPQEAEVLKLLRSE